MPTISSFYGITIVMFQKDKEHNPPHIHAITQQYYATFLIADGTVYEGRFPTKAKKLVKEFILKNREELEEMWESGKFKKLPPIE